MQLDRIIVEAINHAVECCGGAHLGFEQRRESRTISAPTRTAPSRKDSSKPKSKQASAAAPSVAQSMMALSPTKVLAQGTHAVDPRTVSAPVLRAAVKLGTAQAQQLGKSNSPYVATAAFIGYLDQLHFTCSDSPDQLATVVLNVGDALHKQDPTVTYGEVMRTLYQSVVGKAKYACAPVLAAAAAASG